MSEHEKLKEICDKIQYKYGKENSEFEDEFIEYNNKYGFQLGGTAWIEERKILNVKEIIFTQEFMDKYYKYFNDTFLGLGTETCDLLNNLNNPVTYLYNTIELGES